jgi:hypothetical protein
MSEIILENEQSSEIVFEFPLLPQFDFLVDPQGASLYQKWLELGNEGDQEAFLNWIRTSDKLKVDKVDGKSLISDIEIERISKLFNVDISTKVDKVDAKSLILDTEIERLKSVTNQTIPTSLPASDVYEWAKQGTFLTNIIIDTETTLTATGNVVISAENKSDKNYNITLPNIESARGFTYSFTFNNPNDSSYLVGIKSANNEKIQSDTLPNDVYLLELNEEFVTLISDGTRWVVIAE